MKIIWLIGICFIAGCNTQNPNDSTLKKTHKVEGLKTQLQGQWGGLGEGSPFWEFKGDSLYYFEEKKTYPYQIIEKDLVIQLSESRGVLKNISVVNDTMTFYDEQGLLIKGYRFKTGK